MGNKWKIGSIRYWNLTWVTDGWTWTMLETSLELAPDLNGIFPGSFDRTR